MEYLLDELMINIFGRRFTALKKYMSQSSEPVINSLWYFFCMSKKMLRIDMRNDWHESHATFLNCPVDYIEELRFKDARGISNSICHVVD